MEKKVTIIGAGNVGASLAQLLAHSGLSDVVLYDVVEGMPQGKALDMMEACPLWGSASTVTGTNGFEETAGSDVIVITAGLARKPGMSRDDLLAANAEIVSKVSDGVKSGSPEAVYIIVTNPMDVMAYVTWKVTGLPHKRVFGMGGVLDSARMRTFIARECGVSPQDVEALVLGGHGDQMVPLANATSVKGLRLSELISQDKIDAIVDRTKNGGAEIVSLLKTGSAYYAPAASAYEMVKSVLLDEKRLLPCAIYLDGEYGVSGVYVGAPVILGSKGVEKVIEIPLAGGEKEAFQRSVDSVQTLISKLDI